MFARYASAISSGTVMTFGLLFVMQLLITLQPGATVEVRDRYFLNPFKLATEDTPVDTIDKIIPKEKLTKTELPPMRPRLTTELEPVGVHIPKATSPITGGIPVMNGFSDGPLVAMVRVAPVYPARAVARNLEGWVLVQFDVLEDGRVSNTSVVQSSDSVFDKAAITAAEHFKFKPRVVDGVALPTPAIQNLFRFILDEL